MVSMSYLSVYHGLLHELGLTGEPCLGSMLVIENNVVSIVAVNNMFHHLAQNTC